MRTILCTIACLSLFLAAIGCAPAPTPVTPTATPLATSVPPTAASTAVPTKAAATIAPTVASTAAPTKAAATTAPTAVGSSSLTKLRVPYTAISVAMSPTWVAFERGLFKKYGLDVTMDYIATSPVLTAAMLSGEVQIAEAAEAAAKEIGLLFTPEELH